MVWSMDQTLVYTFPELIFRNEAIREESEESVEEDLNMHKLSERINREKKRRSTF